MAEKKVPSKRAQEVLDEWEAKKNRLRRLIDEGRPNDRALEINLRPNLNLHMDQVHGAIKGLKSRRVWRT